MKRKMLMAALALLVCALTAAQAQSPLDRLRNRKETVERKSTDSATKPEAGPAAGTPAKAGQDSKYPPGILFSSLLSGMILHPDGNMTFDGVSATFLPPASSAKQSDRPYNPDDGGKLDTVIKSAGGSVVARVSWFARPTNGPFWLLGSFVPGPFIKMAPGDYVAEFTVGGSTFYKFPFAVVKEGAGDDPFAAGAGEKLVLKGAWEDFGYLFLPNADPANPLQYKSWFRSPVKKGADISVELMRDGKKVAESDPNTSESLATKWERLTFEMRKPGPGAAFTGNDLLGADGRYRLVVKIDGKLYGNYPFSVQGGKIQHHPRHRRGEADPFSFIEGGNDAWFVEREK